MIELTQEEINEKLRLHKMWLNNEEGGVSADLRLADLSDANLSYANLSDADLSDANLSYANLSEADLRGADLSYANLRHANLSYANLSYANLSEADLSYANLSDADLSDANLSYANLSEADLRLADLKNANLDFSSLPLWCGSLKANFDDRLAIQLLYHLLSIAKNSTNISDELKSILLTDELKEQANKFHRVNECGKIL